MEGDGGLLRDLGEQMTNELWNGGRTMATRETRLMCHMDEPVIPVTNASFDAL
jgi:hypothetical protein